MKDGMRATTTETKFAWTKVNAHSEWLSGARNLCKRAGGWMQRFSDVANLLLLINIQCAHCRNQKESEREHIIKQRALILHVVSASNDSDLTVILCDLWRH